MGVLEFTASFIPCSLFSPRLSFQQANADRCREVSFPSFGTIASLYTTLASRSHDALFCFRLAILFDGHFEERE